MSLFKSLLPEIMFISGALTITIGMFSLMGWQYGLIFIGGTILVAAAYLSDVINTEAIK